MRVPLTILAATLVAFLCLHAANAPDGWPHWRGPADDGMARGDAPLHWSDTGHIAWKTTIPGRGFSSPVVWGDRIFVTTAVPTGAAPAAAAEPASPPPGDRPPGGRPGGPRARGGFGGMSTGPAGEHKFLVLAVDRQSGKQLWEKVAATATPHEGHHPRYGSYASNSPITDGRHVVAFFGSRGLYCYSPEGRLLWSREMPQLHMNNGFGEGAWTALDGDKLVLVLDQMGDSFLLAIDVNTGKELWRTPRDGRTNWSGPYITSYNGRKQVIVAASQKVCGYDLETGKQIWEATGLGANTIPAPVADGGLVFVMSGFRNPNLMAIRLGHEGNLNGTDAIAWQNQRGNSYTPSPVLHEGKLYVLTDNGMLSCFDAKTGKPYYQQERLPKPYNFKASPVGANGKLYLASEDGDVIVVRMGEKFEVLATNTLADEMFVSTPAIVDGEIYLRGQNTLFAIR